MERKDTTYKSTSMQYEDIPVDAMRMINRLRLYSAIKPNEKPCVATESYVGADSWSGAFYRKWTGESHRTLIDSLHKDISTVVELLNKYKTTAIAAMLMEQLRQVVIGLQHLTKTYEEKRAVVNKISTQIERINFILHDALPRNK